jgi:hypothetical protein
MIYLVITLLVRRKPMIYLVNTLLVRDIRMNKNKNFIVQ